MKLTKQQRIDLYNKYEGRCAYCGVELPERWHADHIEPIVRDWVKGGCERPENNRLENLNPSCPSCNIIKNSLSLESFRQVIAGFIPSLNRDSTQYKFAKRYSLLEERDVEVRFWFELQRRHV
ncbi:HNH endonuclease [Sphingobacterium psychroaquaticum]|uniref:HNH endonuclease n=1 Tax=Sphingobacterium psychroaquaticum TaxID=561061 RepID=UPI00106B34E0|nr:HNH endonuclease signature motif containing protein [Sphingobacterium psychroaquaticum]QBQ41098.1 HNH endonuclease [Sphingobacterium psychroaquaticum]